MSRTGAVVAINDANGATFAGQDVTADEQSAWYDLKFDWFMLVLDLGTVAGTSPTLDVEVQCSFDGGTTAIAFYPQTFGNTQTFAQLDQHTGTGVGMGYFRNTMPNGAGNPKVRFNMNVGGTSPSFGIDTFRLVQWNESSF